MMKKDINREPSPHHIHVFEWEDNGEAYPEDLTFVGVCCTYTYKIPPGPGGKKPRIRRCQERLDMDAVLEIVNQAQAAAGKEIVK